MPPAPLTKTSATMTRHAIVRAVRTREGHNRRWARAGKGSDGAIGRVGQTPVARQWSASVEVILVLA
jgi:hypothetical protein